MPKRYNPTAYRLVVLAGLFRFRVRKSDINHDNFRLSLIDGYPCYVRRPKLDGYDNERWIHTPRGGRGKRKLQPRPEVRGLSNWCEWPKGWVNAHHAKQHASRVTRRKMNQALASGQWEDDKFNGRMQLCVPWYDMI